MNELDALIERRKKKVELMKVDGDNSHETLANLYSSPTHFITELLQNAEDVGAKTVKFELSENELVFSHDSKNLFDFNDIRAISNFGDNQEKKEKPNVIGRFGIGFKSVYNITEQPRIISGEYDVTIIDYNIPYRTENTDLNYYNGTKIVLPFKSEGKNKIYELLHGELEDLNLHYLLFLSNIRLIKTPFGNYERVHRKQDERFISLRSETKGKKYFLVEKLLKMNDKKLTIKLAFQLDEAEGVDVIPCDESPLYVFFPTKIETNLKFLVHAPFYTTPARENIQGNENIVSIESDQRNEELKIELGKLLALTLSTFKSMKMLTVDMLNVLPIEKENCVRSPIYKELYDAVLLELLTDKELIPNTNGGYSTTKQLLLLGSLDLGELIKKNQAQKLFGKSFWVSKKVTNDKTKKLRDYLYNDLKIPEIDLTGFVSKIDADFMIDQSDKWLIQFYTMVHKAHALWRLGPYARLNGILRSKPIIRLENNETITQVIPFQPNGKPNAFLPSKEHSRYPVVKYNIAKNKAARMFLEDIGLTTPDIFAELNEFVISKFTNTDHYPEYFDDCKKIIEAGQSSNQEKRNRLIQDLRTKPFILGLNFVTKKLMLLKYDEVYFYSDILSAYFLGNDKAFFVKDDSYSLTTTERENFYIFLREIGVADYPRRNKIISQLTSSEKAQLRKNKQISVENHCLDYELDGLTHFLSNQISPERSVILWQILVGLVQTAPYPAFSFFQGDYSYKYFSVFHLKFDSSFLKQLKDSKWLFTDNEFICPREISYTNIPEVYNAENNESKILSEILGLKSDEIKLIEERNRGRFVSNEEYTDFQKWKSEQQAKNEVAETVTNSFNPDFKPEEVTLQSSKLDDSALNISFQNGQADTFYKNKEAKPNEDSKNASLANLNSSEIVDPKILKEIGDWGQNYVLRELEKEFKMEEDIDIVDLNRNRLVGFGADFTVVKDEEIIRIIEVKSTVQPYGCSLWISGTQWEVARSYFNDDAGEKYWIYCVFNAGQKNAEIVKIKNPIGMWKEGKLLAHPINFVIK